MPEHYFDEDNDNTRRRPEGLFEELGTLDLTDEGSLYSQDLALAAMAPSEAPYAFTQYELNQPRYGLSGRFSRTGMGRTPFEQMMRRQAGAPVTQPSMPDTMLYRRQMGRGDSDSLNEAYGFGRESIGDIGAQEGLSGAEFYGDISGQISDRFMGDLIGKAGMRGGLSLAGLGVNAAGLGMNPLAALSSYGPQALAAGFSNPATMGMIAGYVGNQAPDIAAQAASGVDIMDALHGTMVDPGTAQQAFGGFLGGRQSQSAISRGLAALGVIDDPGLANQEFMDDIIDLTVANAAFGATPASSLDTPASDVAQAYDIAQQRAYAAANAATLSRTANISTEIATRERALPSVSDWAAARRAKQISGGKEAEGVGVGPGHGGVGTGGETPGVGPGSDDPTGRGGVGIHGDRREGDQGDGGGK